MIGFEGGGRRLTARLLGGDFIKYSSRFPTDFGSRADLAPAPLIEAVRRVALVAERGSPVRLVFDSDEVVIEAGSQGQARAVERLPATFSGDERVIAFNPNYLLDGLNAAATPWAPADGEAAEAKPAGAKAKGAKAAHGKAPDHGKGSGPGRIRLEFTSSVKPAVITWVPDEEDGAQANGAGTSGFRYLVVPLRMPGSA
jgi:DNA polymerase III sliding clamp (beta) subunit (PCNA family)